MRRFARSFLERTDPERNPDVEGMLRFIKTAWERHVDD